MPPRTPTRRTLSSCNNCASMQSGLLGIAQHDIEILYGLTRRAFAQVVDRTDDPHGVPAHIDPQCRGVRPRACRNARNAIAVDDSNERTARIHLPEGLAHQRLVER